MKKNFSLLLFLLMLFSSLYMAFSPARIIIVGIAFISVLYFISFKNKILHFKTFPLLIMILFTFSTFVSSWKNGDLELLIGGISILILYLLLGLLIPNIYQHSLMPKVHNGILFSHILILVISIILVRNIQYPFHGVFSNPNSMGILLATINIVIISSFWQKTLERFTSDKKYKMKNLLFSFFMILTVFYLTIQTGSRTSILISMIIFFLPLPFLLVRLARKKGIIKTVSMMFLIILTSFFTWNIIKFTPLYTSFLNIFYYKFYLKAQTGSITSGRNGIWLRTLSESSLFGGGRDFFSLKIGIAGHNTFISLLGQYGYIPTILFTLFCLSILLYSFAYLVSKKDVPYRYLPFLITVSFFLFSTMESMVYKTPMIALFIFAGLINTVRHKVSK